MHIHLLLQYHFTRFTVRPDFFTERISTRFVPTTGPFLDVNSYFPSLIVPPVHTPHYYLATPAASHPSSKTKHAKHHKHNRRRLGNLGDHGLQLDIRAVAHADEKRARHSPIAANLPPLGYARCLNAGVAPC